MPIKPPDLIALATSYLDRANDLIKQFCEEMRRHKRCWKACPFGKEGNCLDNEDGPLKTFASLELMNKGLLELSNSLWWDT